MTYFVGIDDRFVRWFLRRLGPIYFRWTPRSSMLTRHQ